MSNQRGVGKFCSVVVSTLAGTSDSVASISGTILGEGAELYCLENAKSYRYTTSTFAVLSPVYLAASGGGTWIEQDPIADSSEMIVGTASFTGVVPTLAVVWSALPSGSGFFAASVRSSALWTLNTTSGVLTYNGPSGTVWQIGGTLSVLNSASSAAEFGIDLSQNGNLIGGSSLTNFTSLGGDGGQGLSISQNIYVSAHKNDTFQHVWQGATGRNWIFSKYQATFTLLP